MNSCLEYEASWPGFLTLIDSLASVEGPPPGRDPSVRRQGGRGVPSQGNLFSDTEVPAFIGTDPHTAARVEAEIGRLHHPSLEILDRARRSRRPIEVHAAEYLRLLRGGAPSPGPSSASGRIAVENMGLPAVREVRMAARFTAWELDRWRGLLRFEASPEGLWIATIEAAADILDLLVPHFEARLGGEAFLIRDLSSGLSAWGGRKPAAREDHDGKNLWKTYYTAIENVSRRNHSLRNSFMLERFRRHLPELEEET